MAGRDVICDIDFDDKYYIMIYCDYKEDKWYFATQDMKIELTEEICYSLADAINGLINKKISLVTGYQLPDAEPFLDDKADKDRKILKKNPDLLGPLFTKGKDITPNMTEKDFVIVCETCGNDDARIMHRKEYGQFPDSPTITKIGLFCRHCNNALLIHEEADT